MSVVYQSILTRPKQVTMTHWFIINEINPFYCEFLLQMESKTERLPAIGLPQKHFSIEIFAGICLNEKLFLQRQKNMQKNLSSKTNSPVINSPV